MRLVILAFFALIVGTAAWAQGSYEVQPGDVLSVEVLQDNTLNRDVLVLPDGRFSFPFAGTLKGAGLTLDQIQQEIKTGIAPNFSVEPTVFVSIHQLTPAAPATAATAAVIDVYFVGEFASPGLKQLRPGTTFLQALAAGGSFTNFAAQKRIQLRRTARNGQQNVYTINYRAIANGGGPTQDVVLQEGDVILAPERRLFE